MQGFYTTQNGKNREVKFSKLDFSKIEPPAPTTTQTVAHQHSYSPARRS
jgi:hypothetical protein